MSCILALCLHQSEEDKTVRRLLGKTKPADRNHGVIVRLLRDFSEEPNLPRSASEKYESCDTTNRSNDVAIFKKYDSSSGPAYGQTYNMWKGSLDLTFRLYQLKKRKRVLYVQQLESFPQFLTDFTFQGKTFVELLCKFLQIFFSGFEIRSLPKMDLALGNTAHIKLRNHPVSQMPQYLVSDLLSFIHKRRPKDAMCLLGLTWTDLYPCEELNFVLGEGDCNLESAVMCFGHYDSKILSPDFTGTIEEIKSVDGFLLWKLFKAMSHEVCHVLGLRHCPFYECLMNESTAVTVAMSQPSLLCPVCLRKLHKVCNFDVIERYQQLAEFVKDLGEEYPYHMFDQSLRTLQDLLSGLER